MVEPGKGGIFGLTAREERPEAVQRAELEIAHPGADVTAAVVLNELDVPRIAVALEVQENAGQCLNLFQHNSCDCISRPHVFFIPVFGHL
jgi:hypothetical protein